MKRVIVFLLFVFAFVATKAQFSVGADVVSRYIWRGVYYGNSPMVQPTVEYEAGNFTVGAWGSFAFAQGFDGEDAYNEADLYASYAFDFGLNVGLSDYYYPGSKWGEFGDKSSSHAFELNLGYDIKDLSISANYMLNNSSEGAGAEDGITYFELGYAFSDMVSLAVGGGDGWVTKADEITGEYSDNFQVTNVCLTVTKEIALSEKFSLPVFSQLILNPNTEQFNIVFGFSL